MMDDGLSQTEDGQEVRIEFSIVTLWASSDPKKWERLIGSIFEHDNNNRRKLKSVDLPCVILKANKGDIEFFVGIQPEQHPDPVFRCIYTSKKLGEELLKFGHEQQQIADEKQRIADENENNIQKFCVQHSLPFDEILQLVGSDKKRTHDICEHHINGSVIPKVDLEWARQEGADEFVERYLESNLFTKIEVDRLKKPKEEVDVNYNQKFKILTLHEYEPKRGRSDVPENTARIIDFKNGKSDAIKYYTNKLDTIIAPNVIICSAPSSKMDKWGPGLLRTLEILGEQKNRRSYPKILRRTRDTDKRTKPGSDRSLSLNLETIEVADKAAISDRPVVVIDDVTTTGSTAAACAKLLWDSGCNCVGAIVLGQTPDSYNQHQNVYRKRQNLQDRFSAIIFDDEIPF